MRLSSHAFFLLLASITLASPLTAVNSNTRITPEQGDYKPIPAPARNTSPPPERYSPPPQRSSPPPQRTAPPRQQTSPPRQTSPQPMNQPSRPRDRKTSPGQRFPDRPDHVSRPSGSDVRKPLSPPPNSKPSAKPDKHYRLPRLSPYHRPSRHHHKPFYSLGVGLPYGYFSFVFGSDRFYGYRGAYYMRTPEGYTIINPPIGAVIPRLPPDCVSFYARGGTYYLYDDIYYFETVGGYQVVDPPAGIPGDLDLTSREFQSFWIGDKEYLYRDGQFFIRIPSGLVWVEPPVGAVTTVLPEGYISIWYQDVEYFELEKIYFEETDDGFMIIDPPWEDSPAAVEPIPVDS